MTLVFLLGAELDIQRAYSRLENHAEGRGDALSQHLDEAFARIAANPLMAPLHYESYRRLVLRKFPLGVFYVLESDRIVIHALLDLRQDPEGIRRRLLGEG
jgi:plasmid stabilization system protein ParE